MTASATGYYLAGTSWLHRRHPLTKLLAVLLVLVAAFLLPPVSLVVLAVGLLLAAASAGLGGPLVRSLRIPARAARVDRRRQRAVLPGRSRRRWSRSGRSRSPVKG